MVTEAWIQNDRHQGMVHSRPTSEVSDRHPQTLEHAQDDRFGDADALNVAKGNHATNEQSSCTDSEGNSYRKSELISSLPNKDEYDVVVENDAIADLDGVPAAEKIFTKSERVCCKDVEVKTVKGAVESNARIATGSEITLCADAKRTESRDSLKDIRPNSADVTGEPLFLEVLLRTSTTGSHKSGRSFNTKCRGNNARIMMYGDLISVEDSQGNSRDKHSGTEFTKSANCKAPEASHISKGRKDFLGLTVMQNYKSRVKSSYSERYGIDCKYSPVVTKTSSDREVQQKTNNCPWNVHTNSGRIHRRMSTAECITMKRDASLASRVNDINILQHQNKVPGNTLKEGDLDLSLDFHNCLPTAKRRHSERWPAEEATSEKETAWNERESFQVDDINNNRDHIVHPNGALWATHRPVSTNCVRDNSIIMSATTGAKRRQSVCCGKEVGHLMGSSNNELSPLVITGFSSTSEDAGAEVTRSHWSTLKQAITCGRVTDFSAPEPTKETASRPETAPRPRERAPKVTRSAPPKIVGRKSNKSQQAVNKNVAADGEGEPQPTTTSLIEDPILVKVSKRNRNVGKFTCKPDPMPNAVCFEIPGTELRHQDVKIQVQTLLKTFPDMKIAGIQFHNRALVNNQKEMNNRWIITTNSEVGCRRLVGNNLTFGNHIVQLRLYDEVISTEYQQFVRMSNFVRMMDTRKILS